MTDEVKDKAALRAVTVQARAALDAELAGLSEEQMLEAGVIDDWSVKDVLAHIAGWERMFIGWLDALMRGERPDRPANIDEAWVNETNARLYRENGEKTLADVLAESRAAHEAMLALIDRLTEEELFDPNHFPWTRGHDMAPWLRGNADEHYAEHTVQLRAWRRARA